MWRWTQPSNISRGCEEELQWFKKKIRVKGLTCYQLYGSKEKSAKVFALFTEATLTNKLLFGWLTNHWGQVQRGTSLQVKLTETAHLSCTEGKSRSSMAALAFPAAKPTARDFTPNLWMSERDHLGTLHARKSILLHMFIYSTTTSICAFWTVTKWCFIACCIDDAKYICSSPTIFLLIKPQKE